MEEEFLTKAAFEQFQATCSAKHQEVAALSAWLSKLDGRMWSIVVGLLFNSIIGLAALLMLVIRGVK